ncbi:Uncharacterised protein [Mycobacteroides abscessus]|nr:Uncharacterised protein [Mycobacteroides abscessus]SHU63169.1 Uncharacterised protein [Mycobacteroides abscessus subsp. abscessus]SHU73754.1 Uncharacterised protein [Mycobacteroides abscessus subsp. abscessus]SIM77151.1 Uncharacterised protein [Mycobacteroides abscessus subsp. abscessus]SIM99586.1 Uncharacterised protein [Mycobacteroides abscessus subsp. abscessus]
MELFELGVVGAHRGVEHLAQDQRFAGPLFEASQRDITCVERHRAWLNSGDTQHWNENSSAREHFDDKADNARLFSGNSHADHDIADPSDRLAVRAENDQA